MESLVLGVVGLILMSGLGVWAWYIAQRLGGRDPLPRRRRRRVTWGGLEVALILLFQLGLLLGLGALFRPAPSGSNSADLTAALLVALTVNSATIVAAAAVLALWRPRRRLALGLTAKACRRQVKVGLLAYLASVPVVYGAYWAAVWVSRQLAIDLESHPLQRLLAEPDVAVGLVVLSALAAVVTAPVCEELIFRGMLQGWLSRRAPTWLAIVLVAILFGSVHPTPTQVPLALLGLMLGYLFHRTGSLVGPIVLHACFNASSVLFLLIVKGLSGGSGAVWGGAPW